MTVTTEDGGRQSMYATEPRMYQQSTVEEAQDNAEKTNGRLAMVGIMAAFACYAFTGQIIPGLW